MNVMPFVALFVSKQSDNSGDNHKSDFLGRKNFPLMAVAKPPADYNG